MTVQFLLSRPLAHTELVSLLPTLLGAAQVRVPPSMDRLLCEVDDGGEARLDAQLPQALRKLQLAFEQRRADEPAASLHAESDAVLTVQCTGDTPPQSLASLIATLLAEESMDISGLRRLNGVAARAPVFEVYLRGAEASEALRDKLPRLSERWSVDINLTHADMKRPRRRLIVFDMDSTLIACEVIDELAMRAGVGEEVAAITARAMRGELDFRSSFRERMARLQGLSAEVLDDIAEQLPIMAGAEELLRSLRSLGHRTAILSGGFDYFAERVRAHLGIDEVHANRLQLRDGVLTGEVEGAIVDGQRKVELLEHLARQHGFDLADTVAVGDGANDIPMLLRAGLGVAHHAKPLVREQAPCTISFADLTGLLYLLGVAHS